MNTFSWRKFSLAFLSAAAISGVVSAQRGGGPAGPQQSMTPEPLKFRYMGPAAAGRIATVAGVPGDPKTYYLGSASGGVWKSTDGGQTFVPIFDDQPVAAIGAIAVAASDPNIVWVGTGESWVIRYSDVMGDGVYVSKDAGKTWKNMGLKETGRISRVIVHPTDPNTVYVCAHGPHDRTAGRARRLQDDRRRRELEACPASWTATQDAPACRWIRRIPTSCSPVPGRPSSTPGGSCSGGPGSGVYLTKDGGAKWTRLTKGLPTPPVGKIDVQIAPSDSNRMYALDPDRRPGIGVAIG